MATICGTRKGAIPKMPWQDPRIFFKLTILKFLINNIPTPYPYKDYTVIVIAGGYDYEVLNQVHVLPGAAMSLEANFSLTKGKMQARVFDQQDKGAPFRYADEREDYRVEQNSPPTGKQTGENSAMSAAAVSSVYTVWATREGAVGKTTANGHVIQPNDRFVALPSGRALSRPGGQQFQVRLTYNGRSIVVPVWDVGPWNTKDDYWSPSSTREMWKDLPQGLPEAQAAFQNNYNAGKDGSGRRVLNPAGIDIADELSVIWECAPTTG